MAITFHEALARYRMIVQKNHPDIELVKVNSWTGPDESIIICRVVDEKYQGPWYRFYQDGGIEIGVLWGGDVWDAGSLIQSSPSTRFSITGDNIEPRDNHL